MLVISKPDLMAHRSPPFSLCPPHFPPISPRFSSPLVTKVALVLATMEPSLFVHNLHRIL